MMTKNEEMIKQFEIYIKQIADSLAAVKAALVATDFAGASRAMTAITTTQARVSTTMRSEMIRAGLMGEKE
jgi:hypothetical protein